MRQADEGGHPPLPPPGKKDHRGENPVSPQVADFARSQAPIVGLVQPDGAVVVPAGVAADVLRILARAVVADAREHGSQPSPACRRLLAALYESAQAYADRPIATDQQRAQAVVTVAEAARRMECSTRWVRRLLASGRLSGRKDGGTWLVLLPDSEAPQRIAA